MDSLSEHHPTIIKLGETVELSKCKKVGCCRYSVHCPFCDVTRLKPMNAYRIRDHLEIAHFQHGVYYEDYLLVKCYQDCKQKAGGHYHCPLCPSTIIKRLCFRAHLLSHTIKLHKSKNVIGMPDSKHPQEICCHDYTVSLCREKCAGTMKHHYHCPVCRWIGHDRSDLITHLWRCVDAGEGKRTRQVIEKKDLSEELHKYGAQENIPELHPKYNTDMKWHVSMVRTLADLPLEKCTDCCDGLYHCVLCPLEKFTPSPKQNLIQHYMSHWKSALTHKGYCVMCCYNLCGKPAGDLGFQSHYHCPICGALRRQKETMFSHLQICQGEGIKPLNYSDVIRRTVEGEHGILTDIEMVEQSNQDSRLKEEAADSAYVDMPPLEEQDDEGIFPDVMSDNLPSQKENVIDGSKTTEESVGAVEISTGHTDMRENEIFDSVTAVLSSKLLTCLGGDVITSLLHEATSRTGATWVVSPENGPHVLLGDMDTIVATQKLLLQSVNGSNSSSVEGDNEKVSGEAECDQVCEPDVHSINTTINREKFNMEVDRMPMKGFHDSNESTTVKNVDCPNIPASGDIVSDQPDSSDDRPVLTNKQNQCRSEESKNEISKNCLGVRLRNRKTMGKYGKKSQYLSDIHSSFETKKSKLDKSLTAIDHCSKLTGGKTLHSKKLSVDDNRESPRRYSTRNRQVDFSELAGFKKKQSARHVIEKTNKKTKKAAKSLTSDTKHKSTILAHDTSHFENSTNADHTVIDTDDDKSVEIYEKVFLKGNNHDIPNKAIEQENMANENIKVTEKSVEENDMNCGKKVKQMEKNDTVKKPSCSVARIPAVKFLFEVKHQSKNEKKKLFSRNENSNSNSASCAEGKQKNMEDGKKEHFTCTNCDFVSDSFSSLTSHLKENHKEVSAFRCDVCERIFSQKAYLANHLQLKHGPRNVEDENLLCQLCDTKLDSKSILNWHMSKFHGLRKQNQPKNKQKTCEQCSFQSSLVMEMRHHKLTVHSEVPQCEFCGRHFAKVALLKTHIQTVHTKEKSCVCHVCGKAFNHVRYLRSHLKRHGGEKKHACSVCGWRFYDANSLKDHMETHKDKTDRIYKYICSYCGKGFRNKANFNDHQNKHTGNKPYQCGTCGRCFGFRSELGKHHIFVHSSSKPFKCYLCEKAFKLRRLRDNHMSVHSGRSDFMCKNCHRSFSCKSTLKVHEAKCRRIVGQDDGVKQEMKETVVLVTEQPVGAIGSECTQSFKNIVIALPDDSSVPVLESDRIEVFSDAVGTAVSGIEVSQTELYLCSECNATFDSYNSAEQHVVFCHMDHQGADVKSDIPLSDSVVSETEDSVSAIMTDSCDTNIDMSNHNNMV